MKIANIISKVISILTGAIIFFMIVVFLVPKIIGYTPYSVITGSMEPSYSVGSMIYVKSVSFNDLKVGDAITFKGGNYLVTHRIVEIDKDNKSVITKGDANNSIDGSIKYDDIVGRASDLSIPHLGYISNKLSTINGKVLLVIILGGLLVFSYLLKQNTSREKVIA